MVKNMISADTIGLLIQLFQIAQVRGLGESFRRFFGGRPTEKTEEEKGASATRAPEGGAGTTGEHNYLLAAAQLYFGKPFSELEENDIAHVSPQERQFRLNRIFELLRAQGRERGAVQLMEIVGKESHVFVRKRPQPKRARRQQAKGNDNQQPQQEDTVEAAERVNPSGFFILLFLTSLTPEEAVRHLELASVSNNAADKAAAAVKGSKEALKKAWEDLKAWYREHDTEVHLWLAKVCVGQENVVKVLDSENGQALRQAVEDLEEQIESEKDKARLEELRKELHGKHEDLQRFLLRGVKQIQREEAENKCNKSASHSSWTLEMVLISIIAGGIAFILIVGAAKAAWTTFIGDSARVAWGYASNWATTATKALSTMMPPWAVLASGITFIVVMGLALAWLWRKRKIIRRNTGRH